MAVNIGPKIGIDGEKEYRKQINDLITQQKTFSAEMKELESTFDSNASAMDKNRKKSRSRSWKRVLKLQKRSTVKIRHRLRNGNSPSRMQRQN